MLIKRLNILFLYVVASESKTVRDYKGRNEFRFRQASILNGVSIQRTHYITEFRICNSIKFYKYFNSKKIA